MAIINMSENLAGSSRIRFGRGQRLYILFFIKKVLCNRKQLGEDGFIIDLGKKQC